MVRARRRRSLTDYRKRIALLKSGLQRVVVRKSNRAITMQVVEYDVKGDRISASANSRELKAFGWEPRSNIPTAYLTGLLLARKAKALKGKRMTLDIGLYRPIGGSVVFAAAKGSVDGGLNIASNIEFNTDRLSGAHIASFAGNKEALADSPHQFSAYAKAGFDAVKMKDIFESVKNKLLSG